MASLGGGGEGCEGIPRVVRAFVLAYFWESCCGLGFCEGNAVCI